MPRPPRHALPLGSLVDRYVLRSMIGRGGTATVYEAEDPRSGERVAVKVLDPERPDAGRTGEPERHRMLREARLTSALGHPAIVRVLDAGLLEGGRAFLVMERLAGRTLAQRMDECFWLPLDESRAVAAQLLDALEAAHAAGIVHRDVKPTNVFLLEDAPCPRVKLIDFGIGVDLGDPSSRVTEPDVVLGTVGYMAPEQLFGDEPTARSDVYAAGATLYEMLAGRPPLRLDGGDVRAVLCAMTRPIEPLSEVRPSVPEALAAGVMQALARRPADRHASCRAMREACGLDAALAA